MVHQVAHLTVIALPLTATTIKVIRVAAIHPSTNSSNTRRKDRATLNKVLLRARDTNSSNPMAMVHLCQWALPHPTVLLHQCHLVGLNSGTRTASDGSTSSKLLVVRNGILPRICLLARTLLLRLVLLTWGPVDTTSVVSSVTPMVTKVMTILSLAMQPMRPRKRRTRAIPLPCWRQRVLEVSQQVPGLATS